MPEKKPKKLRLDLLLIERDLVPSREKGRRMIMAGEVSVNGQLSTKPGSMIPVDARIDFKEKPRFVSRGGDKLAAALEAFQIDVTGSTCADVGASTGGFTDCLLQAGAQKVYAIDVGHGQLAWTLRNDDRVVVMERVNARHLECLPEEVALITCDASFISLGLLVPNFVNWLTADGQIVVLVKPQFEAGREQVGKGGVVRDANVHRSVLEGAVEVVLSAGLTPQGLVRSPLEGPAGNIEFLLWATRTSDAQPEVERLIDEAMKDD